MIRCIFIQLRKEIIMATVINNPDTDAGSGAGLVIAVIVGILIIALFFIYGLPALRNNDQGGTNINVTVPENGGGQSSPDPTPAPQPPSY